eukprot:jgi/Ulvmu1/1609/UM111_0038.1
MLHAACHAPWNFPGNSGWHGHGASAMTMHAEDHSMASRAQLSSVQTSVLHAPADELMHSRVGQRGPTSSGMLKRRSRPEPASRAADLCDWRSARSLLPLCLECGPRRRVSIQCNVRGDRLAGLHLLGSM